jgi:fibronectin type 3 domain-containing protein
MRSRWLNATALLLLLAVSNACGWKTAPQVPESPRPEAIKDIKVITRDAIAFLSWTIPTKNIEGKNLNVADLRQFRIERAEIKSDRKKPRYRFYAEIDMANPAPATIRNGMVFWSDKNLKYDQRYGYRVRALSTRGGVSKWSDEVRIAPLLSLATPKELAAQAGDGNMLLSWTPVTTRMDGSRYTGFVGYNIYRGSEKGRYSDTPVNKEPLRTNSFQDAEVANDTTYFYVVRTIDSPTPPWKEGLDSDEVSATPRDLTPPDRPTGLTVVPGVDRVFLTWNENKESDLVGYHVYRSTASSKDYERLTEKPLLRTTYSDEAVKTDATYYYVIRAVDKAGNESARSAEKKAFVEALRKKFNIKEKP